MKAAILVENKQPLIIDDISLPNEIQFGQVLVDIHYSGICGAQINEIDAAKGPDKFLPHLLGHEGSGIVQKIDGLATILAKGSASALEHQPVIGATVQSIGGVLSTTTDTFGGFTLKGIPHGGEITLEVVEQNGGTCTGQATEEVECKIKECPGILLHIE